MTFSDLRLRFVAYAPNGNRIATLPDVTTYSISRVHNELASLTFDYSNLSRSADIPNDDCEIAVEWNDGAYWREDSNSRFLVISSQRNQVDPTGVASYTCPGYAYNLSKATVVVDPLSKNPNNQKRQFSNQTIGAILRQLVSEAKGRGNLPGLTVDFTTTTDSAGDAWLFDDESPAFDRGQDYLSILMGFATDGKLDWRMQGRVLQVFNPGNELEAPRANRKAIHTATVIDPDAYISTVLADTVDYAVGGEATGTDGASFASDVVAVAADGVPNHDDVLNYGFTAGVWNGQSTRSLATYRQLGENPSDTKTRAFGSLIAETTSRVRYLVVLPGSSTRAAVIAGRILDGLPGGAILTAGTGGQSWWTSTKSGMHVGITSGFMHRGIPVIVLDEYTDTVQTAGAADIYGIIQNGYAASRAAHSQLVTQLNATVGLTVLDSADSYAYKDVTDRADWLIGKSWEQSRYAASAGATWVRVLLRGDKIDTAGQQNSAATAIIAAISSSLGLGIVRVQAKPSEDPEIVRPPASAVEIRYRDATEATTTRTLEDAAAVVFGYGDNFSSTEISNTGANLPWGPWEMAVGQGGLEDPRNMEASLYKSIDQGAAARIEITRRLPLVHLSWLPYRDYDPGDIVRVQNADNVFGDFQIKQMVVSVQDGDPVVDLTMATIFRSREEKVARSAMAANGTVGSSARVGGVGVKPSPNSSDNRTPSAPTNLTVTASRTVGADGVDRPALTLSWDPVTTATDTSAMTVDGYAISAAVNGGDLVQLTTVLSDTTSTTVTLQQTDASLSAQVAVAAIGSNARSGTPALSGSVFLGADTTPPPAPSMPTATSRSGQTAINWDGTLTGAIPPDFDRVEVMVSGLMAVTDSPANYRGSLQKPGSIVLNDLPYGNTIYFALVAVDFRGNRSPISAVGQVSVQFVDANDIADGSVDDTKIDPTLLGQITSANGKNKVTYSTVTPNVNGENAGDIWFQYSGSTLIGSWRWTGAAWSATQFGNGVIGTLDAGKITTGILDANRISVANLSTLSTNLGNISAGTLTGVIVRGSKLVGGDYARIQTSETFLGGGGGHAYYGPTLAFLYADSSTDGYQQYNSSTQSGYISGQIDNLRLGYSSTRYLDINSSGVNISGGFTVNGSSVVTGSVVRPGDSISTSGTVSCDLLSFSRLSNPGTGTGDTLVRDATYGYVYRQTSSLRYKQDVVDLTEYERVLDLRPVFYKYKTEADQIRRIGLIAEETFGIMPELVTLNADGVPDGVQYQSGWVNLIPIIRDIRNRLSALEALHG